MAPPRKSSKRRRGPQPRPARARPPAPPPAKEPPADAGLEPDLPTIEEVDLSVGAPPEDLGTPHPLPPDDDDAVELLVNDDEDGELFVDDEAPASVELAAAVEAADGRSSLDELEAEDELLPAARNAKGRPVAKSGSNRVVAFLRASWAELQRVQWPDRRQVGQATAVVLGFVVIAGGYLGLADVISQKIVDAIL